MLTITSTTRLFFCRSPMNMLKSFEGLSAAVDALFPGKLLSGAYFIFLNRFQDYIKVLYFDGDGLAIWSKRLEKGSFPCKWESASEIDRRGFVMLLEEIIPKNL